MNKKRKKIINIISIFIIIGGLALAGFSPVFVDMLKKASAQNEGEMGDNVAITEDVNTEVTESTEMSYDTLEVEDTIYAVSMGEGEGHIQLSSVTSVSDLVVGKNYMVETYEDWQKIYNFSQVSTLKDITFWLYYPGQSTESKTWELTSEHIKNGIGSKEYPFSGTIKPFYTDMTIKTSAPLFAYLSSDAVIGNAGHNNNPMTITNEIVSMGEGIGAGGLATNYVMKSGETVYLSGENSKFKNLKITGTITNVKGTVGGLFGNVILEDGLEGNDEGTEASTDASAEIILDSDSISIEGMKEVSGYIAGGLFGEVSGNITMTLNSMPSVAAKVYGYYDGYNTGKAGYYYDGMISQMKVCAGGLIGKMTNEAVLQTNNSESSAESEEETYLTINNLVMSDSISGGIVGAVQNSTVKLCYVEKDSEDVEHLDAEPYLWARYIGGGFIGLADSSKIELDNLKLGVDIKVCYTGTRIKSSAGGIIGRYITDESDTESYLRISNLCTENTQRLDTGDKVDTTQRIFVLEKTDTHNNNCGGIIGSCNGNNVRINKIELTPEKYNVSLNYMIWTEGIPYQKGSKCNNYSYAASGAIAGSMAGLSIEISDIIFDLRHNSGGGCEYSNGIAGYYVGDIAGQVGLDRSVVYENNADVISDISVPTKMKVSDITVKNSYVFTAQKYQGGLFGYVGKGAIICLSDNINLSQIPFQTFIGSDASKVNAWGIYIMLAPSINGGSRGLIAGYAEESLIYFEEGAIVTRSITQTEGEIVSNMIEVGNAYVPFDPNNGTYYEYVIDDIGNAGSVFQNFSENGTKIIDYSQAYGKEVTGTIDKNAEGKYVIDSLGDALRLAIVGQTYDMSTGSLTFAANCFADDTSISDILSANYLITTDLNLGAANIQSFLRSDATINGSVLGFSGSMEGQNIDDSSPTITMNSISRHKNGGLYPLLQSADNNDTVSYCPSSYRTGTTFRFQC